MEMLRHNLAFKVTLLIVGILLAGFGTLLVLNIRQESEALVVKHQETVRLLTASVTETIEIGMLRLRPDIVRRLMQQLKTELKDVQRIGVYRRSGVEAFADTKQGEIECGEFSGARKWEQTLQDDVLSRLMRE